MDTPVAIVIFNRPHLTARVFEEIARAKPSKLFVIADGPRSQHPTDHELCQQARAVTEKIDWRCEVQRYYSDTNLGCGIRPASGITKLFKEVDQAIILEDDCLPHPTFFRFCEELLERFKDDKYVMHIGGQNLQPGRGQKDASYFFSWHNLCAGGFATWRRAWSNYDFKIENWQSLRDSNWLHAIVNFEPAEQYWKEQFDLAYKSPPDLHFWDYQWTFACWQKFGLSVLPNKSLLTNIGYGEGATNMHTVNEFSDLPLESMEFPLSHAKSKARDINYDQYFVERVVFPKPKAPTWRQKIWRKSPKFVQPILSGLAKITR